MLLRLIFLTVSLSVTSGQETSAKVDKRALPNISSSIWKMLNLEPEARMTLPEMVKYYGYPFEVHSATTEDGYILTNHRIPHGRNGQLANTNKLPVILLHGAYSSSDVWLHNVPDKSLGYLLADAGHDVWLHNCRGNYYSRKHKTLTDRDNDYWDFSLDEVGNYDTAAIINDVINKTGKSQVYIVGHSMGGGMPLSLLSDRPEYNKKIKKLYLLSPAGTFAGIRGFMPKLIKRLYPLMKLMKDFGLNELASTRHIPLELIGIFAKYFEPILSKFVFFLVGPSPNSWNTTRVPIFAAHSRNSIGFNILIHLAQPTPPDYDLDNVAVPTHLFHAPNDYVIGKENNVFFLRNIKKDVDLRITGCDWNHLTFFWGNDTDMFFNSIVADIANDNATLKSKQNITK